jgi:hypothetical protein
MRRAMTFAILAVCVVSIVAGRGVAENSAAPTITVTVPKAPARTLAAAILEARERGADRGPISDRVFRIKCVVIERDAEGKEQVLSRPHVMTLAGQPAHVQIGAATPLVTGVEKAADGKTKPLISVLESGIKMSMKIVPEKEGRAAFDLTIERAEIESVDVTKATDGTERQSARVGTKTARVLESIELGKNVTVGLDHKDPTKSKVRVEVVVEEVRAADVNR